MRLPLCLAALFLATPGLANDGFGDGYAFPNWSIVLRYHWTQTFPAGQVTRISHACEIRSGGGLFGWSHPPEDCMQSTVDRYCIDDGTSRALVKVLAQQPTDGEPYSMGLSWNIAYDLRTANSWDGPIGRFRLTIDKKDAGTIVSLCADGITKTGPTTCVMERADYVPARDLHVLIATPMRN